MRPFNFWCLIGWLVLWSCTSNEKTGLEKLEEEISNRPKREAKKKERIKKALTDLNQKSDKVSKIESLKLLFHEYKSYSFDSASKYSKLYLKESKKNGSNLEMVDATINHAYILLSAGIINPAIDSLKKISLTGCDPNLKSQYYFTLSKGYYELANFYSEKTFSKEVYLRGNNYLDSAIVYTEPGSIENQSFSGFKALQSNQFEDSKKIYQKLVLRKDLPIRQLAMEAACLAKTYEMLEDEVKSIEFYTLSAISDEVSSVKEYTSLIRLANYLFARGDLERSNLFISLSLEDANFFGSMQRKIQILEILPLIKAQQLVLIKEKRDSLLLFSSLLVILLIGCVWLIVLSIRQNKKIKKNEEKLEVYNHALELNKSELEEAQIIKEQYVGHFFQSNTRLINKLEKVFSDIEKSIVNKDLSEIKFQLSQIKPAQEKKKLLRDFDQAFLSIFPEFVSQINQILEDNSRFTLEDDKSLNTELRIFALMRMGIHSNDIIARALGYSVNTIYTYKTKIRNKSTLSTEDFDAAILNIQSVKS